MHPIVVVVLEDEELDDEDDEELLEEEDDELDEELDEDELEDDELLTGAEHLPVIALQPLGHGVQDESKSLPKELSYWQPEKNDDSHVVPEYQ